MQNNMRLPNHTHPGNRCRPWAKMGKWFQIPEGQPWFPGLTHGYLGLWGRTLYNFRYPKSLLFPIRRTVIQVEPILSSHGCGSNAMEAWLWNHDSFIIPWDAPPLTPMPLPFPKVNAPPPPMHLNESCPLEPRHRKLNHSIAPRNREIDEAHPCQRIICIHRENNKKQEANTNNREWKKQLWPEQK
jgi:hypothetical protein